MKFFTHPLFYSLVFITSIVVFMYKDTFNIFYQQDEWQTIGNNIVLNNFWGVSAGSNILDFLSVQERFGSNILSYFMMGRFSVETVWVMGVYSLFFHLINSILVFLIIRRWVIRNDIYALLGSLFFAVSDVSISAVSWFGTSLGTLPAITLVLVSIIFYFKYLDTQAKRWLFLVLMTLYTSFFFKEVGIFLLIYLPLASLIFRKYTLLSFTKTFWPFVVVFLLTTVLRLVNLVFLSDRSGELFITSTEDNFFTSVLFRTVMYPLTSFSLIYIPQNLMLDFAKIFTNIYYPYIPSEHFNLVAQTLVIDLFAVLLSFLIIFMLFITRNSDRETKIKIIFWGVFLVLSFLPYVLLSKSFSYLESRYYYLSNLPAGIILVILGYALAKVFKKGPLKHFGLLVIIFLLVIHAKFLSDDLNKLKSLSLQRKEIIKQFLEFGPRLEDKNIFYLTGNHDYYLPGNKVPFQQGMGYTLMVINYGTGKIPKELIEERFLWNLNTQGYREVGDSGFGFFSDRDKLKQLIDGKPHLKDKITALHYDYATNKLTPTDFK